MTVLFLLYIGFDVHGPSLHLLRTIVKDCLEKGHHVRMIARSRGGQDPVVPEEFITNSLFSYDIIEDSALEKSALAKRYCEDIRYAYRCKKIYEKYRDVDVVFLQSNTTPIFAIRLLKKNLSCPILFNVQNIFPIDALVLGKLKRKGIKGVAFYILRKMQQAAYRHSDCIITISEDMKHTLCQEGVSPEKIQVIYNWSYGDDPVNVPEEDNLFIKAHPEVKGKFRVVFAGNLGAMVDPYIIADSAEKLSEYKDIQFVIIGAGNNMKTLKELVEEKKLSNMLFYPYQPVEYAPHNYAMAHVNINALPKEIIKTCLPSKTATMLNSSRPMVVAVEKNSGYAKILNSVERCTVVDPGDSEAFVSAILDIFNSHNNSNSSNSRNVFRKYFSEVNAEGYVGALEQLASKR